jgi:hypothetical protein
MQEVSPIIALGRLEQFAEQIIQLSDAGRFDCLELVPEGVPTDVGFGQRSGLGLFHLRRAYR